MTNKHPDILDASGACLIVVDIQECFQNAIPGFEALVANASRLVNTFQALSLPILVTEQYPKGLGPTVSAIREAIGEGEAYEKTCFSSCGSDDVSARLVELSARRALLCGIESHVCVSQTAHDLLQRGVTVHVAVDAVDSRRALDRDTALARMERAGVILTTAEAAAFELLGDARHPKFKDVQALFK